MSKQNDKHTRLDRRKKRKEDRFLNVLIGVVVVAIVVIAFIVLPGDKEKSKEEHVKDDDMETSQQEGNEQEDSGQSEVDIPEDEKDEEQPETEEAEEEIEEPADVEVTINPDDAIVSKSIVDPAWAPVGTSQQGEHVSLYDGNSVDWQEKLKALTYTTGLPENEMIVWKLKNGGSPQSAIGIVSSKDKAEKYRVYLEWVDDKGWQPVKMDILKTLEFDY